ncbi:magnesium transporter CorA [Longispora fulva]|uniref:Magnesium transporter n=1 Tax=Longispora fulva TaxID=619741 RepID=A0A8J7GAP2_9ACTN|nr:magnesium and cobalt transport protein CorA [Longispora fulva]MBG6134889.1 magnesium transporter [Longispora fulva]GIG56879.1 magnesium transporter CorA [Longispora fulva]
MSHDKDVPAGIVDCALYRDGVRVGGRIPLDLALESAQDVTDGFVWIGLYEPTTDQLAAVAAEFGLHPLAVEDAVNAHQRAKLEIYGDIAFTVFKTVRYVDPTEVIEVGEVMCFLGRKFVVTVRHGLASPLTDVRRRLESDPELLRSGPGAVLYAVADHIVDEYNLSGQGISIDIDEAEFMVFDSARSRADNTTERLYKLKREVLEFRRAVRPLVEPLGRIVRGELAAVDGRTREYFRDVEDNLLRVADRADGFAELLTGTLAANMAQIQSRENADMRKITAWVAILSVNTLIVGIYGQNFVYMPELRWRFGYPIMLTVMLTLSTALYRGFKRNRWI